MTIVTTRTTSAKVPKGRNRSLPTSSPSFSLLWMILLATSIPSEGGFFFVAVAEAAFLVGTTTTTTSGGSSSPHGPSQSPASFPTSRWSSPHHRHPSLLSKPPPLHPRPPSGGATGTRLPSWLMSLRWISSSSSSTSSSVGSTVSPATAAARPRGGGGGSAASPLRPSSELRLVAPGQGPASSLTDSSRPRATATAMATLRPGRRSGDEPRRRPAAAGPSSASSSRRRHAPATQLFMGIRSLLGLGGGDKGPRRDESVDDEDDEDGDDPSGFAEGDGTASSSTARSRSTVPPNLSAGSSASGAPLRMGEDPVSKEVNVLNLDHRETTQERINRVKAGFMTEAEKKAFLQTALTAGNTAESRRPLQDGDADAGNSNKSSGKRFFASPFPSDSILRNFARGGKGAGGGEGPSTTPGNELDSQKKKREYLDMVTNPDRFNRKPSTASGGSAGAAGKTPIPDLRSMELKTSSSSGESPPPAASATSDLGVRLGMAAMANESLRRQQEQDRKREIQWKMDVERRQHEQRAMELTEWQQKMAGFEAQQRELRSKEEERRMKQDAEKRQAEKARLEQLMKAQDEYWAKKLEKEKSARIKQLEGPQKADDYDAVEGAGDERVGASAIESTQAAATMSSDSTPVNEKPLGAFNPDESNLLDMAKKDRQEDWEENQEIMEEVKARTLGVRPTGSAIETEEDFMEEQARKKRELDRKREEQMLRLKALNSPLPSPAPGNRPPAPVFRPQVDFRPQRPVSGPAAPLFGRDSEPKAPAASPNADSPKTSASRAPDAKASPSAASAAKPQASMWGSFNFGGSKSAPPPPPKPQTPPSVKASAVKPSPSPPIAAPAVPRAPSPASAKTGPIRMKLPLGDGGGDEDGVDVRANKRMSIADAMRRTSSSSGNQSERSKKWGIDMSKFADD